jgi:hypothetical protein
MSDGSLWGLSANINFKLIKILHVMAKYSKGAGKKVEKVMKEKKAGTLKSGSGKKVTSRKQAIAIGLSEARKQGSKVPAKKAAPKKSAAKKAAPKKAATKKAAPKRSAAKKAAPKKRSAAKKSPATKAATKKAAVKKPAARKAAPKKTATKQAATKRAVPVKKAAKKKSAAKKPASRKPVVTPSSIPMEETNNDLPMAANEAPAETPGETGTEIPTGENTEKHTAVEEPNEVNPLTAEQHGAPMPPDKYASARDTFHGHTNPSSKKGSIKPSGKKPLWK